MREFIVHSHPGSPFGRSVMAALCTELAWTANSRSDHAYALNDGKQPKHGSHKQGHSDRCRSHVLDPSNLLIVIGG